MNRTYQAPVPRAPMLDPSYWSRKDSESRTRPQAMSTKILGLGLFLVGVLILSVGLIIGLEFPKYVRTKIIEDQCILNTDHVKFESWRSGSQWTRTNRLYFWTLQNKEGFLYHGEEPQVKQRGPYVYTETIEKTNITFNIHEVWFNTLRRNVMDRDLTRYECGYDCREHEELTLINQEYLRQVALAGSETDYTMSCVSQGVTQTLLQIGVDISLNITDNISTLGCLSSACDSHILLTEQHRMISFGAWLRQNDTSYKSVILDDRGGVTFSKGEMVGLYHLLTSRTLLKGENSSLSRTCTDWARHTGCAFEDESVMDAREECGVIPLLELFSQGSVNCVHNFTAHLQTFLCSPVHSDYCFTLPSKTSLVNSAYLQAISEFVLIHIATFVQENFISNLRKDLVTTRNQSDFVFGYFDDTSFSDSTFVPGVFSDPGSGLGSANQGSPLWTLSTCLQDRNINNNMMMRKLDKSQYAPTSILRDESMSAPLTSHTDFTASCGPLQACVLCQPHSPSPNIFIPELWRRVTFGNSVQTSLYDNTVFRFFPSNDTFSYDDVYNVTDGLQSLTGLYSYLAWRSNPYFLYASGYPVGMTSGGSADQHLSYIDVEPDTGRVWQRKFRTQFNVGVTPLSVNGRRRRALNVTYLDQPIPVYWIERGALLAEDELGYFNYKVGRLMRVSCGGVIGISVLAAIVMVISIVVCVLPPKTNRVAPATDDNSLVNHNR